MSTVNVIFLCLIVLIVGFFLGAACHWAIGFIAKVKDWEKEKLAAAEATVAKDEATAKRDLAIIETAVKTAVKEAGTLWAQMKADIEAASVATTSSTTAPTATVPATTDALAAASTPAAASTTTTDTSASAGGVLTS
jgi:hypothetical protein